MAMEIERKFLVSNTTWREGVQGIDYAQGYIPAEGCSLRVRIAGEKAFITLKARINDISRREFEYPIPKADAEYMLRAFCRQPLIEKTRYTTDYQGMRWEIDEFKGDNAGLIVAEIELEHEDQPFARPDWLGKEVTHDPRYINANLVAHPYSQWKDTAGL